MFLALDQGTTSSRALVFSAQGEVLGRGQYDVQQHYPASGLVEQDAEQILATQVRAMATAHEAAGSPKITAVGIANQRETVVLFERTTGKPLHRALVWQDRRTAAVLAAMQQNGHGQRVHELTGLTLDPYFSAAKMAWLLDHVPGARAAATRGELGLGTIDTWLIYALTGGAVFATEPSNASRTSLFDIHRGDWSEELLELFGVPPACLPEVRDSADDFGKTAQGWPIRAVLGDQQAALFGQQAWQPGAAKCTYGTGAFLLAQAGSEPPQARAGLLTTVAWRLGGALSYALEGSVFVSGALVQWLRDGLRMFASADELEALARSVDDSDGVVIVPALAGLGTPYWDPEARGLLIGCHRGTTRAHVARAALEAMAYQVLEVLEGFHDSLPVPLRELRVDGGAARNDLLMQLQADLAQVAVSRPAQLETTALGVARLAMLSVREGRDPTSLPELTGQPRRFEPRRVADPKARERWREAVSRCRGWSKF